MSLLQISLPWWLSNKTIRDFKNIFLACWQFTIVQINKIFDLCHVGTCPEASVDILWDELPLKPDIADAVRRNFIIHYNLYTDKLGTRPGIMLTQSMFDLDYMEVQALRDTPVAHLYPWFALRIRLTWDDSRIDRIIDFLNVVKPARTKFHTQVLPPRTFGGFGKKPFGKTFGLMPGTWEPGATKPVGYEPGTTVITEYTADETVSLSIAFGKSFGVRF